MKKTIATILAVLLVLSVAPITAFAENGPHIDESSGFSWAFIRFFINTQVEEEYKSYTVFAETKTYNDAIEGASYDLASNTLTITDFNHPELSLSTNMMGDDFKLRVIGSCALDMIYIWGDMYGGSLDIQGNGTLTVNEAKTRDTALVMNAEGSKAKLNLGKDVKVNLYGKTTPCVINYSAYDDLKTGITAANGEKIAYKAEKEHAEVNDTIGTARYTDLEGTWTTDYGILFSCETETDKDVIYGGHYYEEEYYTGKSVYTIGRYKYLKEYDAYVADQSFGDYGQISIPADELADSPYSVVMANAPVMQLYTDDYMEEHNRGLEGDLLTKASDPSGVYVANYSWTTDREHPDTYYIRRLIWDDDIEFYVPDPDFGGMFGSESYDVDEFSETDYAHVLDESGDRMTVRYLDEYTGIENYGSRSPLVLNDKTPDVKYVALTYTDDETGEETYLVSPLVYNEKRGYYFVEDSGEWMTPAEFEASGYHYVYEEQPVPCKVKHTGEVELRNVNLYRDAEGKQYGGARWDDKVYEIDFGNTLEVFGETYYFYEENETLKIEDLTPITHEETYDYYHYEIEGTELHYNAGAAPQILYGDVNGDGKVDITDATMIQNAISELVELDADAMLRADTNHDGSVNITDVTQIQLFIAELVPSLDKA